MVNRRDRRHGHFVVMGERTRYPVGPDRRAGWRAKDGGVVDAKFRQQPVRDPAGRSARAPHGWLTRGDGTCFLGQQMGLVRVAYHPASDANTAWRDGQHRPQQGCLRKRDFRRVFIAGLAFDFCVRYSVEDARREGFESIVIEDACRGIDVDGSMMATRERFRTLGIRCIPADAIEVRPIGA